MSLMVMLAINMKMDLRNSSNRITKNKKSPHRYRQLNKTSPLPCSTRTITIINSSSYKLHLPLQNQLKQLTIANLQTQLHSIMLKRMPSIVHHQILKIRGIKNLITKLDQVQIKSIKQLVVVNLAANIIIIRMWQINLVRHIRIQSLVTY